MFALFVHLATIRNGSLASSILVAISQPYSHGPIYRFKPLNLLVIWHEILCQREILPSSSIFPGYLTLDGKH